MLWNLPNDSTYTSKNVACKERILLNQYHITQNQFSHNSVMLMRIMCLCT